MRRLALLGAVLLVMVLLGVAQLVLPGIAAQRLRSQLSHSGQVLSVEVHAFPAIELLWHQADKVVIRMGTYSTTASQLPHTLAQAGNVGQLYASAEQLDAGLLRLRRASLVKQGDQLHATATVSEADLRRAVPILQSVTPVASSNGQLTLRGTASLFGLSATADAIVSAQNGDLVLTPSIPIGTITLFSNPHVAVDSVSASPATAGQFAVQAAGTLH